ncbi:uncharacterized protein EV422DRAFT_335921 [Fimicolochytrium jonesii]|uniref:uncharacterized protein n=1 Tax=Fimicolochytrium jonesii TaxID=1396493 RepID=UPI0022FED22E|nr:uncharacterized protein EV422DRAFT_335921 [Fimicolochytrium jonesii]KAI8815917.1 hypothetical protein EV422DRAFT_335921 [Fimicolochytrium jonesii]
MAWSACDSQSAQPLSRRLVWAMPPRTIRADRHQFEPSDSHGGTVVRGLGWFASWLALDRVVIDQHNSCTGGEMSFFKDMAPSGWGLRPAWKLAPRALKADTRDAGFFALVCGKPYLDDRTCVYRTALAIVYGCRTVHTVLAQFLSRDLSCARYATPDIRPANSAGSRNWRGTRRILPRPTGMAILLPQVEDSVSRNDKMHSPEDN